MRKTVYLIIILCGLYATANAQQYTEQSLRVLMDTLSAKHKGYNNTLQLNVTSLALSELINSVALENSLNVSVDPALNQLITYNFFDAQIKDMFIFIYTNFDVEYEFVGSILAVKKRTKALPTIKPITPKKPEITFNSANQFLSLDLKGDTLWRVTEEITRLSGKNFVVAPEIRNKPLNGFIQNRPIDQVIDMLAKSNALQVKKEDDYLSLSTENASSAAAQQVKASAQQRTTNSTGTNYSVKKTPSGTLNVSATGAELNDLLMAAAGELDLHFVLYTNLEGKATVEMNDVTVDDLFARLFSGSKYSFTKEGTIYVIGEFKHEGIRKTSLIRIENRTIEAVKTVIPKELTAELDITEFVELNGLIVSGVDRKIEELKRFISQIDVVVPMVQIDVMLISSKSGSSVSTGIKAGLKDKPTTTSGTVFPGVDVNLGAQTINGILNTISGFGLINLGKVTENFYVSLQALESNSTIDVESTPKISTLNGHEATISIGEKTYYQESQVNFQTTIGNTGVVQSKVWKPVDANLSVKIKPFVSADEYVTLTISVTQDDFSGKVDPASPPNQTTQKFESLVRVKNGEVILLGGLEKKKKSDSGSGVPLISRVPILKWFFSSRAKDKEKSKLHIIIRPTVTY